MRHMLAYVHMYSNMFVLFLTDLSLFSQPIQYMIKKKRNGRVIVEWFGQSA